MSFLSFVILGAFWKIERIPVSLRNEIRKNFCNNYNRCVLCCGFIDVGFYGSVISTSDRDSSEGGNCNTDGRL